eukprot:1608584-Prymnesium_polylepis.1
MLAAGARGWLGCGLRVGSLGRPPRVGRRLNHFSYCEPQNYISSHTQTQRHRDTDTDTDTDEHVHVTIASRRARKTHVHVTPTRSL